MSSYEVCRHRGCRGKVPMYHPSSVSANQKPASLLFDQSEAEKLAHEEDSDDEFFTVTIQGGYSQHINCQHLYQESKFCVTRLTSEINGILRSQCCKSQDCDKLCQFSQRCVVTAQLRWKPSQGGFSKNYLCVTQ